MKTTPKNSKIAKKLGRKVKFIPVTKAINEILDRVENRDDLGFVVGIQELPEPQKVVESDEVQVMVDPNGVLYPSDLKDLGLKDSTEEDTVVKDGQLQECDIFTDAEVEELNPVSTKIPDGVKAVPVRNRALEDVLSEGIGKAWKTEPLDIPRHEPKPFDGVYPPPTPITKKIVDAPHEDSEADSECEDDVYEGLESLASQVLEEFGPLGSISPGEEGILYLIRKINTERLILRDLEAALRAATEIFIKEGK